MTEKEMQEKVNRMQKIGAIIWKPTLIPYVELKVEDKDGKVLTHINKLCESFNRNFFVLLTEYHSRMVGNDASFGSGYYAKKDTAGAVSNYLNNSSMIASAGVVSRGIIVGTSTTAESFEHYIAQAIITHGNTAGQLAYQAQGEPTHAWTVGTLTWEIDHVRVFNNNSTGTITVNEVCLYYLLVSIGYMVLRDKLSVGVDVPDAAQLTVTYHLQMVFPE